MHDEGEFCLMKIHHYTDCHYPTAAGSSGDESSFHYDPFTVPHCAK